LSFSLGQRALIMKRMYPLSFLPPQGEAGDPFHLHA
jgi:hypothetical protein